MGITHPKYKVAAVQAAPIWLDLDATVDKCIRLIQEAADKGCQLIAFPETFIPGYPWHIWMGAPACASARPPWARGFPCPSPSGESNCARRETRR